MPPALVRGAPLPLPLVASSGNSAHHAIPAAMPRLPGEKKYGISSHVVKKSFGTTMAGWGRGGRGMPPAGGCSWSAGKLQTLVPCLLPGTACELHFPTPAGVCFMDYVFPRVKVNNSLPASLCAGMLLPLLLWRRAQPRCLVAPPYAAGLCLVRSLQILDRWLQPATQEREEL